MDKLRIYLVDDHKLFREGLKLLLSTQDFVRHIYEASNGREFIENLSFVDCDVVLMDIEMPEMNGIDATIEAMKMKPNLKIIVLSMYGDEQYYYKMIDAGAKGFLLKNSGIDKAVTAIQKVAEGESFFSEELLVNILNNMLHQRHPAERGHEVITVGVGEDLFGNRRRNGDRQSLRCITVLPLI